jgi:hypothetical protein
MIDEVINRYIQLRDRKAELKKEFDNSVADIDAGIERLENYLLGHFQKTGQTSAGTQMGTAYLAPQTSATVADWETTLSWIKQNDAWHFLERKVNKTAVVEFRSANDDLPPGVNWREENVVRVRRSS